MCLYVVLYISGIFETLAVKNNYIPFWSFWKTVQGKVHKQSKGNYPAPDKIIDVS